MATILVVDDKALNRSVLTTLLGYRGHRLLEASSGSEALDMTRTENPELVITDIVMPNMDGYELVRKLRELDGVRLPQIIFYSATYLEEETLALARACGVSKVICKPTEPEQILKIVDETLASDRAELLPIDERAADIEAVKVLSNKLYRKVVEVEELNSQLEWRVAERTAELENATLVTVDNVLGAMELVKKTVVDPIVSDVHMPHLDGYAFRQKLLKDDRLPSIPFAFISSPTHPGRDRAMGHVFGVTKFISRPSEPERLLAEIEACHEKGRSA